MSELLPLSYHAVSPRLRTDISVTPACLEAQLLVLPRHGYWSAAFHDGVTADDATLERELRGSRERCEDRLGRPCRSLASGWRSLAASP